MRRDRRFAAIAAATTLLTGAALVVQAGPAAAAGQTRYVAKGGTDGENTCTHVDDPCATIQHAVVEADPGDTVSIGAGTYDESVHIRKSLTLVGAGSSTTIDGDDDPQDPSIWVDGVDTETAPDVTVQDLDVSENSAAVGILVVAASVTVLDSSVDNNAVAGIEVSEDSVSGPAVKPALQAGDASATISHSTVSANAGPGVEVGGGDVSITGSTLDHNAFAGVLAIGSPSVTVTRSTISHTVQAQSDSGPSPAGGILAIGSLLHIDTSTLYGNAGNGVLSAIGATTIDNSTITATGPTSGVEGFPNAGIAVENGAEARRAISGAAAKLPAVSVNRPAADVAPGLTVTGSIDADNTSVPDCSGPVDDGGYNLASDESCAFSATGSTNSGHALLGPLTDNGGPTQTAKPAKHSDAVDKIPSGTAGCTSGATDQRGVARPQGPRCDIGAVEDAQPPVVIKPDTLPDGTVGVAYHQTITATGGFGAPYTWSLANGQLPPGLTFDAQGVISGTPTTPGTFHFTVSVDDPTLKAYTIVITGPVGPSGSSSTAPIANTGAHVKPLASLGTWAIALGVCMLLAASWTARWARRYRRAH